MESGDAMPFDLTTFNVITCMLLGSTAWVIWARFNKSLETSWPLIYYLGVVIYMNVFEGALEPVWVYVGVVTALFLRFEFMGGVILKTLRAADLAVLLYIAIRAIRLLLML